jgi:thiosulfate dehydrogenase (quinone) large subunit
MIGQRYTHLQMTSLVILRVLIGWHFLYEGIAKLQLESWSAAGFLMQARGPFEGFFRWMAQTPNVLEAVNWMNMIGLTAIGLGLIVGLFTRFAALAGALMILLFYLCNPPFIGYYYSIPMEGSYLIVNKNLVEMAALLVIAFTYSGRYLGLDRILHGLLSRRHTSVTEEEIDNAKVPA